MNKTYLIGMMLVASLVAVSGTAAADQLCGVGTCTSTRTNTDVKDPDNTSSSVVVQGCTGNIIVQYSGGNSTACSGNTTTYGNCQTQGAKADCGQTLPGSDR